MILHSVVEDPYTIRYFFGSGRRIGDNASLGRSVGACGFAGLECAYQHLGARKCDVCGTSYHELCALADANLRDQSYEDGCPSCFANMKK